MKKKIDKYMKYRGQATDRYFNFRSEVFGNSVHIIYNIVHNQVAVVDLGTITFFLSFCTALA